MTSVKDLYTTRDLEGTFASHMAKAEQRADAREGTIARVAGLHDALTREQMRARLLTHTLQIFLTRLNLSPTGEYSCTANDRDELVAALVICREGN